MLAAEGFNALHFVQLWAAGGITTFESCIPAAGALLGISGFDLDPHYCQLPVAEEVQPDRNSCPAVLTVVRIVLIPTIPGKPLII